MNDWPFRQIVSNEEGLRQVTGHPGKVVERKVITYLDKHCRRFISQSPFLTISTANSKGQCDSSPRGDHEGFVYVADDYHLVIPERPGNRRTDSMSNIIENPQIGLLFLIPGLGETLRINGQACVISEDPCLEKMAVKGKTPVLGIGVKVDECFIHCAKAFIRSGIWKPGSWTDKEHLPSASAMLKDHINDEDMQTEDVAKSLKESYEKELY